MKWKWKLLLIKIAIGFILAASLISATVYTVNKHNTNEQVKIIEKHEEDNKSYIISKETVMSKLDSTVKIVSMKEDLHKSFEDVDTKGIDRHTELKLSGTYQMGIHTKDIHIMHIDNERGILHIKLGKPSLIALDLPYNKTSYEKTSGWLRMSMNEEEQKNFYKSAKVSIEKELLKDKEIDKKVRMYNEKAVKKLFSDVPNVRAIVFE
ncbi:DUF4230 domain-containing protein [Priestia megaterium]|uniref:DUF4230 domain-containing protein n=1 Tax=Priestia megaterium TaxID=1404 RepID=UPI00112B4D38|nr:DUF4230 domain-containing protein [Priestia megaterium]TPF18060.1 hypothetical protein CBE78_02195 [Priestia megaterium]TPF22167.1 hypothetical protein CBE79_04700 [Priestia megaterium]